MIRIFTSRQARRIEINNSHRIEINNSQPFAGTVDDKMPHDKKSDEDEKESQFGDFDIMLHKRE